MKGRGVILKITAVVVLFLLVIAAVGQANVKIYSEEELYTAGKGGSSGAWEDTFNDASKIDPNPPGSGMSDNYEVSGGSVKMINTYEAWTDPDFTKMKVIDVTNSAGQTLYDYALDLTIPYDSDMQSDYDDLRFVHEYDTDEWLSYWIESYDSSQAEVWVSIPTLQIGTTELYMFYGNSDADSESDFGGVFSDWEEEWDDDEQVTNHANNEGTWDPDVCFNDDDDEFLVAWEEGQAYYPPWTWGFKQEIRASIYDSSGSKLVNDKLVYKDSNTFYRNENPSIAYGNEKWFVAWQRWDPGANPSDSTLNIRARFVERSGTSLSLGSVITVCNENNIQADPTVTYDSTNNRFFVCWEDARDGTSDYQIYGKLYNANTGQQIGSEKTIADGSKNEVEPWVTFDPVNSQYFIVWEEGETANNGPFRIAGAIYDDDIGSTPVWSGTIDQPDGYPNDDLDYNFPCVYFNSETEEYLVTWNDDDISDGDWWGDVYGKIINPSGGTVADTFTISEGEYVRTDIKTYSMSDFDDPYFVTYDNNLKIWGKFVTADGETSSTDVKLSVSTDPDMVADWANMDFGDGKIFVAWEDLRVDYPAQYDDYYPDVFVNLWELTVQSGLSVSYSIGDEISQVLLAHVTSIEIEKGASSTWDTFSATGSDSGLEYSILDGDTGNILIAIISPGGSLSEVTADSIRLMATFTRDDPSSTPEVEYWSVNWITNNPPNTPSNPDPEDGETDVEVTTDVSWTCSDPDGDDLEYDVYFGDYSPPPQVSTGQTATTYDPPGDLEFGTTYYWKILARDVHGAETEGPIWDFTTWENNPPNTPSDPDPSNGETGVDVNADLSWTCSDPDGDDLYYDVYFDTVNPPVVKVSDHQTATTYDPGLLEFEITYYWQIIAFDEWEAETEGPVWSFTTGDNDPPYVPSDPDPEDGETNVDINADLSWTGGDPDGDDVVYDVYFDTIDPPVDKVSDDQDETTFDPGQMAFDMTYYWKIISKDEHGSETEGNVWSFTTGANDPPYVPSNPYPADGAIDVDINDDISWTGGDPNPGDPVKYDIYLDIKTPPNVFIRDYPDTTYDLIEMSYDTKYYWKIVAKDSNGAETEGPIWSFTTIPDLNNPPGKPTLKGPMIVEVNQEYEWTVSASEPDGEDVYYRVKWGDNTLTDWLGPYESGTEITVKHTYTENWTPYVIVAQAKDTNDVKGKEAFLPVLVQKNTQSFREIIYNFIKNIFENRPILSLLQQISMLYQILIRLIFNQKYL